MVVKITDKTNINDPTKQGRFLGYKLNSFVPNSSNLKDFCKILKFLICLGFLY